MSSKDTQHIEPKLRFPKFRDLGDWHNIQLAKILSYERPENYIVSHTNYKTSGIPVLTANKSFILGYTDEIQNIYEDLPVIIFDDFTTDKKYVDFPFKIKSSAIKILKVKGNHNLKVVYELLDQIQFNATQHKRHYISEYQHLSIPLPIFEEQQKVADCLSSIDELITAESKKLDALKVYKKGLMQQLFPAEGETIPNLRFPEFQNDPEWLENTIGKIAPNVTAGATPSTTEPNYWGGKIRWMNSGELNLKRVYEVQGRITQLGLDSSSTRILPLKCVLVGLAGQGKTRGTVAMNHVELCTNQSIAAIHPNESVFSSDFLYHNLDIRYEELRRISAGDGGRGGLNLQIIKNLKLHLPKDKKEQQKIANCLSSIDELVTVQSNKIKGLKNHKKGLMQQLFPTMGEV